MNTHHIDFPTRGFRIALVCTALAAFAGASTFAQVTIPSKSSSSLEEDPGTEPVITTVPAPSSTQFNNKTNLPRVTTPGTTPGEGTVTTQSTPIATMPPDTSTATVLQRVPPNVEIIDESKIRRLAELRRELRIADAATQAKLAMPTDDLFESDDPTRIDDLSEPALRKVMEFIELNDKKQVTVNSYYVRDQEGGKELAWARSLALIEWMTANSTLGLENYKATGPSPVTKATPKAFATKVGDTEFVNRTEIVLDLQ